MCQKLLFCNDICRRNKGFFFNKHVIHCEIQNLRVPLPNLPLVPRLKSNQSEILGIRSDMNEDAISQKLSKSVKE